MVHYVTVLNSKNPCVIPFHMVMNSLMIHYLSFAEVSRLSSMLRCVYFVNLVYRVDKVSHSLPSV